MRALATFRDGRIVAAGTLRLTDGTTKFVAIRLLPTGEIDPSFGAGFGYVLAGPAGAELDTMTMDRNGNVLLAGSRPSGAGAETPIVIRLLPDGNLDPTFAAGGTFDGAALGLAGRVTGVLVRPEGPILLSVGGSAGRAYPATFTAVRLGPTGAPDPTFAGTGIVNVPLGTGSGAGVGAQAIRSGPDGTILLAGTDLTETGTPRGAILRVRTDGTLDTRFGQRGVTRISRAGDEIRITDMVRDNQGRILLSGSGRPPERARGATARQRRARQQLRQRRPDVPAARPPAGRRPDLHDVRRDRRRRLARDHRRLGRGPRRAPAPRRPARSTPAASRSPSRNCSDALVEPGHVRFVLGLHQDAAQDADAVGVQLDVGVRGGERRAVDPQRAQEHRVLGGHPGVEHARRGGVDLRGARRGPGSS